MELNKDDFFCHNRVPCYLSGANIIEDASEDIRSQGRTRRPNKVPHIAFEAHFAWKKWTTGKNMKTHSMSYNLKSHLDQAAWLLCFSCSGIFWKVEWSSNLVARGHGHASVFWFCHGQDEIQYYHKGSDGQLHQRLGAENPFEHIRKLSRVGSDLENSGHRPQRRLQMG